MPFTISKYVLQSTDHDLFYIGADIVVLFRDKETERV
jgi:hypothetical protein